MKSHFRPSSAQRGFTLIEVLIAVAIIGILAGIALPTYFGYVTQTRRTDAIVFLAEVAGEQERFFSENNQYATDMKELGYGTAATFNTPEGFYTVSVNLPNTLSYVLTAAPVTGGKQANDTHCGSFSVNNTGGRSVSGAGTDCW